ncbi:MAG: DUF86 domain-containing protein [Desulfuromusa sp.]|nr:DUF86 domain-containing protein [Desulfuromusa sp.]
MLECIQRMEQYVGDDRNRFFNDMMLQDAILRVLQVMAESSQRISEQAKKQQPEIDWRGISGFRNILVHDYLGGVDLELIWQVIEAELPKLKKALNGMS